MADCTAWPGGWHRLRQVSGVAEVELVEVSARDGLQNDPVAVSTAHKVELIERAVGAGFRRVEVASFVSPKRVPQMADAEAVMAVLRLDDVVWSTLALNTKGVERAIAAGADEINFVVTCSETFNQRNQGCSIAESLAMLADMAPLVRAAGKRLTVVLSTSFGCPFEGEVPVARVVEVALGALEARPDELSLADTIGVAVPSDVIERVGAVRDRYGDRASMPLPQHSQHGDREHRRRARRRCAFVRRELGRCRRLSVRARGHRQRRDRRRGLPAGPHGLRHGPRPQRVARGGAVAVGRRAGPAAGKRIGQGGAVPATGLGDRYRFELTRSQRR